MKLPKNYFENLSAAKYREYLKLLPNMQEKTTYSFVTLALTFIALSFFGVFAINPTLSTIFDLQKQLSDDTLVNQQLQTKIDNLSALEQQYNQMGTNLTNIYNAVPQNPNASLLSAEIVSLAQNHNLTITNYRIAEVELASRQSNSKVQSFIFTVQTEGKYNDMINFSEEIGKLNRIITLESMEIGRDPQNDNLILTLRGRQYFKDL